MRRGTNHNQFWGKYELYALNFPQKEVLKEENQPVIIVLTPQ
jgi:hypothetical protein